MKKTLLSLLLVVSSVLSFGAQRVPSRKGVIDGVSKLYDENGKLQEEILFKNGQKVK